MKKHKPTLKWCARQIRKWAKAAGEGTAPRDGFDSTILASRRECASRMLMLELLASEIELGRKQ